MNTQSKEWRRKIGILGKHYKLPDSRQYLVEVTLGSRSVEKIKSGIRSSRLFNFVVGQLDSGYRFQKYFQTKLSDKN